MALLTGNRLAEVFQLLDVLFVQVRVKVLYRYVDGNTLWKLMEFLQVAEGAKNGRVKGYRDLLPRASVVGAPELLYGLIGAL